MARGPSSLIAVAAVVIVVLVLAGLLLMRGGADVEENCVSGTYYGVNDTGECRTFANSCLPSGWTSVDSCPTEEESKINTVRNAIRSAYQLYVPINIQISLAEGNDCEEFPDTQCTYYDGRVAKTAQEAGQSDIIEYYVAGIYDFSDRTPTVFSVSETEKFDLQTSSYGGKTIYKRFSRWREPADPNRFHWDADMFFNCGEYWVRISEQDYGTERTFNANELLTVAQAVLDSSAC